MTVLSRGVRARRGGRRPGWVLLTVLLAFAMVASSALVFTNRVELLKLAVVLALWAAIAGAFVSVLYRRQSDADQSRMRDLKLVYDLQLDREISARREYELTVESQLRRELASELRAQAADDVAALRAELASLRTSLEILFDTDLAHRRALEKPQTFETDTTRGYGDWARNGESSPVDWVASDRVTAVRGDSISGRPDEASIIDVPEVGVPPVGEGPAEPPQPATPPGEPVELHYEATPPAPEPTFEPRQPAQPPPPPPQPEPQLQQQDWQPIAAEGQWLPPGSPGSNWTGADADGAPPAPSRRRRRARHSGADELADTAPIQGAPARPYGESGHRARSRHSADYRDFGVAGLSGAAGPGDMSEAAPPAAAAAPPPPQPAPPPPPPRLAPAPPPEPAPRHRGGDPWVDGEDEEAPQTGGQSVADLFARLQVDPSGGGRRRRRSG